MLALLAFFAFAQTAFAQVSDSDVRAVAKLLQCPVCEGESAADSRSQVATDMRAIIKKKLDQGESKDVILQYFVDRYGPGILREPPRSGLYSAVWWGPIVGLGVGIAIVYVVLRRLTAAPGKEAVPELPETPDSELKAYQERLKEEMDAFERRRGR